VIGYCLCSCRPIRTQEYMQLFCVSWSACLYYQRE